MTPLSPALSRSRSPRPFSRVSGAFLLLFAAFAPLAAAAATITFDDTQELAPATFADVLPGGEFGPQLDYGDVMFDGGIIALAITPSDQAATTLPNLYATTDFAPLADGSLLSGMITAVFAMPVTSVALDVGNGNLFSAKITLTAFSGSDVVASDTVLLDAFASLGDFVGHLEVAGPNITSITVTSDQPAGTKSFSVDTVTYAMIPEPSTGILALLGVSLLAARRRRFSI